MGSEYWAIHRLTWVIAGRADGRGDLYRRAEAALRAAAAAALQRPTLALGPREAAEAESAAVFCARLAALVSAQALSPFLQRPVHSVPPKMMQGTA